MPLRRRDRSDTNHPPQEDGHKDGAVKIGAAAPTADPGLFFLPLINPTKDLGNVALSEFVRSHVLEVAPVSDAARAHIERLRRRGVAPADWRDAWSQPVLAVAVRSNYVALAAWLLAQGAPLLPDTAGLALLQHAEAHNMTAMARTLAVAMHDAHA